ncbi:hypothetical protein Tco_1353448 [Tanacetum coccineum]
MSSYNHFGCSWCGGPFNGGNCPGCSSVGSGNEFVYDPNPYSYNETPNFFNQPPQHQYETYSCELCGDSPHYGFDCQTRPPLVYEQDPCNNQIFSNDQSTYYSPSQPQQFDCCEVCEGPHYSSDCQTRNALVYEPNPCNNYDFPYFDQPSQFTPSQSLSLSELKRRELMTYMIESQEQFDKTQEQFKINQEKLNMDFQNELNRLQEMMNLINSNQDPPVDLYHLEGSDNRDNKIDSLTKEPLDTLLMGDEVISTTPERENDEFIKSSVDDLVPILRESEVTSDSNLECSMPLDSPPSPRLDVLGDAIVDIDLPFGEHLDTLSTGDREIDFNPRDIETNNLILVPRVFDEPLGNFDSVPRSYDVTFSNLLFDFNDNYTLCYDNPLFDEEFEDISSLDPPELTLVIDESSLLVIPHPASKQLSLREVERFDLFFSLTESGEEMRVIKIPSFGFHRMPSPRPA